MAYQLNSCFFRIVSRQRPFRVLTFHEVCIMTIDITALSYDELVALNHKIVERLKFLDAMHTNKEMMRFAPGDQVSFKPAGRSRQLGTLVKYNKKTVTVITESGQKWNVSPNLLRKIKPAQGRQKGPGNIIDLPKKGT
ncbi:MAG: hypothetical protein PVJ53_12915 [Desulfobacterales bacterium]|jgi:hypothetical protein